MGAFSILLFLTAVGCFLWGRWGIAALPAEPFDNHSGFGYEILSTLPPLILCPIGCVVGFASYAVTDGSKSASGVLGVALNGLFFILWLGWPTR